MSAASQGPGSGETAIIFLAFVVLAVLRRIYRSYHGMKFSTGSTIGVLVLYVAIGSFFSITSFFDGVPLYYAVPYVLVLAVSAYWSYRFTDKRISFWKVGDQVYFKGGMILYIIYVIALIARLSIDFIFLGPSFLSAPSSTSFTGSALYATIATDLLLVLGLGLLIGRNARVLKRYRLIEKGTEPLPDRPPDYEPIFRRHKEKTGA